MVIPDQVLPVIYIRLPYLILNFGNYKNFTAKLFELFDSHILDLNRLS